VVQWIESSVMVECDGSERRQQTQFVHLCFPKESVTIKEGVTLSYLPTESHLLFLCPLLSTWMEMYTRQHIHVGYTYSTMAGIRGFDIHTTSFTFLCRVFELKPMDKARCSHTALQHHIRLLPIFYIQKILAWQVLCSICTIAKARARRRSECIGQTPVFFSPQPACTTHSRTVITRNRSHASSSILHPQSSVLNPPSSISADTLTHSQ
jgi:hypothetical protein